MHSRLLSRAAVLGVALLATGGLLGASPALAATHSAPVAALHHRQAVQLPTGDVVAYDPSSPADLRVRTRTTSGLGHAWRAWRVKGHTTVLPVVAAPFLGTVLDPSLFDVTALAKAGARPSVTVGVAKGQKGAVPGLTVLQRSGSTQRGYFTAKGARAFGAALQKAAIATQGKRTSTRSLFGAASISMSAAKVLKPAYQQQTVVFTATGADGQPLPEGLLFYGNLDDAARATGFALIVDGEVRVSLPAGHYTLYSETFAVTSDTTADDRIVTQPSLAITGKANQPVEIDFRTATAEPSLSVVDRDTKAVTTGLLYDREWATGGFFGFAVYDPSLTVRIAPAAEPSIGTASLSTVFQAVPAAGSAEEYDAAFEDEGAISDDQSHDVEAARFADLHERFFATGTPDPAFFAHGVLFGDGAGLGLYSSLNLPTTRLDHLLAPDDALWQDDLVLPQGDQLLGEVADGARTYAPGSSADVAWLQQAAAPAVPTFTETDLANGAPCAGCRTAQQLAVLVVPVQDTFGSGHYGFVADPRTQLLASRLRLYRGSRLLDDERGSSYVGATVPASAQTYRLVADSTPGLAGFTIDTSATTTWTFRSSATTGADLGYDASCLPGGKGRCRVLPMLQVRAPLPVALDGTMATGSHAFPLCVAPIQGAQVAVTGAKAQVSYDDGRTYRSVPLVAGAGGCFTATVTNPADSAGATATVRFTATGSGGSAVVQTVHAAYRVAR